MEEETQVKCPYCNSKDLAKLPPAGGSAEQINPTITYKCQMCTRTFTKTPPPLTEE